MRDAQAVKQIAEDQTPRIIQHGIVRAVRGQFIDVVLDGSGKQVHQVVLDKSITVINVGWWVTVVRHPRTNRWQAIAAYEDAATGSVSRADELPAPADVTATGKPYLIEFSWSGSFKDVATYELQHNSSAAEAGATNIKVEGSNFLYWCAPGTTRHVRVRAVSSTYVRSAWSDWVSDTSDAGEAYMTIGINAGETGVEYQAFKWDDVTGVTGADLVHNHNTAAEGGVELWPDRLGVGTVSVPAMDGVIGLAEASGHPLYAPNEGRIYVLDDGGDTELWYGDDKGRHTQITQDGVLKDHAQYLLADGTRALTGAWDVGAHVVTFGAGITFDGASGANIAIIPDAAADALEVVDDTTGDEYLGFRTAAQKEVVLNEDGVDIDFRVEGIGDASAIVVRGSDGNVGLHIADPTWPFQVVGHAFFTNNVYAAIFLDAADASYYLDPSNVGTSLVIAGTATVGGDVDPATASGQDLGDATHRWDLYTQEVYFGGATGANVISMLDELPDALHVVSADAVEYLRFITTNGSEAVVIDPGATGSIMAGVGVAAPQSEWDVRGTYNALTGGLTLPILNVISTNAQAVDTGGTLQFGGRTNAITYGFGAIKGAPSSVGGGNYSGYLAFYTCPAGSGMVEHVRLDALGHLGIGTPPPIPPGTIPTLAVALAGSVFQVYSTTNAWITMTGGGTASFNMVDLGAGANVKWIQHICDGGAYALHAITDAGGISVGNIIRADLSNGNVGFGTATPSTRLDIDAGAMELAEMTAPGAGAVNTCRLYCVDNGGKTELYAIFNTGAAQLIAAQP